MEEKQYNPISATEKDKLSPAMETMTLRDYFAGQALKLGWARHVDNLLLAKEVYEIADAMLEARKK